MDVAVKTPRCQDAALSQAMTSVPGPTIISTPGWVSGIASLTDLVDAAIAQTHISFVDSCCDQ